MAGTAITERECGRDDNTITKKDSAVSSHQNTEQSTPITNIREDENSGPTFCLEEIASVV
uniref:Uncharacterized protein n=1 Tax=Romanomermis culicivorax TaxID=13658 RepID=A0A915IWA2_ROMCU